MATIGDALRGKRNVLHVYPSLVHSSRVYRPLHHFSCWTGHWNKYGQHVHKPMATGWEIWSSGCLRNGATSQLMVGRLGALMSIAHYSPVSSNVAGLGRWSASCWWLVCLNMFKSNPCHWNLRWWAGKCKVFIAPRKSCCFLLVV
jgi:hypothetical protein